MGAMVQALFNSLSAPDAQAAIGKDITSAKMRSAIRDWFNVYFERAPEKDSDPCRRLPYSIINKLTKTTFSEYDSSITGTEKSAKLAWQDKNRAALDKLRKEVMQWVLVGGEGFIRPIPTASGFAFRFVRRNEYNVLARDAGGEITSVCCIETSKHSGAWYTLTETRALGAGGLLTISNRLYHSTDKSHLGTQVHLTTLPQYAQLAPDYTYPQPLGGLGLIHVKTPMVNCVDGSDDGISVLEPVLGLIRNVNQNERQYDAEFELGKSKIIASRDMLEFGADGSAGMKSDIFMALEELPEKSGVTIFSPALRGESYERRLQSYLREAETLIGLKRGILSEVEAVERTAKEITSSEGDYSLTIQDFQQMWYDALRETLRVCEVLGRMYRLCDLTAYDPDALAVTWGNGILYDRDKERENLRQDVQSGLLKPELYLGWLYDLPCDTPEEQAAIRQKYMPELAALLREV